MHVRECAGASYEVNAYVTPVSFFCYNLSMSTTLSLFLRLLSLILLIITLLSLSLLSDFLLSFSIVVWFGSASHEEKYRLQAIVKCSSQINGRELPPLESTYHDPRIFCGMQPTQPATSLNFFPLENVLEVYRTTLRHLNRDGVSCIRFIMSPW